MEKAKKFMQALRISSYTERHLKIVDEFLKSGEKDCRVILNKLGTWTDDDLANAVQFMLDNNI